MNPSDLTQAYALLNDPNNLIILGLLGIGVILKNTPLIPNQFVPLILLLISEVACAFLFQPPVNGIVRGMVYAGLTVLLHATAVRWIEDWIKSKLPKNESGKIDPMYLAIVGGTIAPAILMLFVACAKTTPHTSSLPPGSTTEQKLDALKADIIMHLSDPAVQRGAENTLTLAGKQALRRAVDGAERQKIAAQMWTLANAVTTLLDGKEVTPAQVQTTVDQWVNSWSDSSTNDYVDGFNLLWQVYYPQLVTAEKPNLWITWLGILARSGKNAAASYYNEVAP